MKNDTKNESQINFYLNQLNCLVGGKITALAKTEDEFFGLVVTLPSGQKKTLLLLSDDEGNDHGSFEILAAN